MASKNLHEYSYKCCHALLRTATNQQESIRINTLPYNLHVPMRIECDSWHSWKIF